MNQKLIVTDYDGTLASSQGIVSAQNRAVLEALGRQNHIRVIATGRNLYSVKKVIDLNFPVDYVIFTTGAGVVHWSSQKILLSHHLDQRDIEQAFSCFRQNQIDFMIHRPIPDNHFFQYFSTGFENSDFVFRKQHYGKFCRPGEETSLPSEATQFVGVLRLDQSEKIYDLVRKELSELNIVRATSPFNHRSIWIEAFSKYASKNQTADFLAKKLKIQSGDTVAIGNDYNDIDLLGWAKKSYSVDNAIDELKNRYEVVASCDDHGFSEAIQRYFGGLS